MTIIIAMLLLIGALHWFNDCGEQPVEPQLVPLDRERPR